MVLYRIQDPRDCSDIMAAGYLNSGEYKVHVNGDAINVWCDMKTDGGGWLVIYLFSCVLKPIILYVIVWNVSVNIDYMALNIKRLYCAECV